MTGGWAFMTGICIGCGNPFTFNPLRVPSSSAITGQREPICVDCFRRINAKRVELGLPPFPPPAADAYEPVAEEELWDL